MKNFWPKAAMGVVGAVVVSLSLFVATFVVFPTGSTLTYKATHAISDTQRVTDTVQHNYPGLLSMAGTGSKLLYSLLIGCIMGIPSGIFLGFVAKTALMKKAGVAGLVLGSFLEYNLESLFVVILNVHRSWQDAPFSSYELPLVGFGVEGSFPIGTLLNAESAILLYLFKPLGVTGIYVLYLTPAMIALLATWAMKKLKGSAD